MQQVPILQTFLFRLQSFGMRIISILLGFLRGNTCYVLALCIFLRCLNIFFVQTFFVPDEYWQSLEVAHRYVFGYGYLTWEWEYKARSHVYIIWIVWLYKLLKVLRLDTVEAVILAPRITQSVFSAVADTYYIAFVYKYFKTEVARWAVFVYATNFFIIHCATRTLTNTAELNLCIIAAYYFPWTSKFGDVKYLWFVGVACSIKPTAFIYWLPLSLVAISKSKEPKKIICYKYIPITCTILFFTTLLDWYMYGGLYFTWYRFFSFNILYDISSWYSTHPLFWYLFAGLPVVLGLYTIFFISFVIRRLLLLKLPNFKTITDQLFLPVFTCLFVLSAVPHKELRFLLPILSFASILIANEIYHYKRYFTKRVTYFVIIISILLNASLIAYFGRRYKSTPLNVMNYLRNSMDNNVLFLLPCHSTPLYSHLHINITARFLHCDPPLPNITKFQQMESTIVLEDPISFLKEEYNGILPTHIVLLQTMKNVIFDYLVKKNYQLSVEIDDGLSYYAEDVSMSVFTHD